jgi:hypothetical protein
VYGATPGNLGGFTSIALGGRMARSWYDVVCSGQLWDVRATDGLYLNASPRSTLREEAIEAAAQAARTEWRLTGEPAGVRVQSPYGGWETVRTFGEGSADAAA